MNRLNAPLCTLALAISLLVVGCGDDDASESANDGSAPNTGSVPSAAQDVFNKDVYASARWTYRVQDLGSDEADIAAADDVMTLLGSTTKLFTIGALYEDVGPDATITTPVYDTGDELVLVAMGDIAMGGRGAMDGDFKSAPIDKVYANSIPGASVPDGNPLAGLKSLADQTAKSGVESVSNVVIDTSIFAPFDSGGSGGGAVSPIVINDNQVDIVMTATEPGEPVDVAVSPDPGLYDVEVDVKTVEGDGSGESSGQELEIEQEPDGNSATVSGTLEAGAEPAVRSLIPPDPAVFARALFIQELKKAGVKVDAPAAGPNDEGSLPESYSGSDEVASLTSPELEKFGSMILLTSYNQGADAMLCQLAVSAGDTDCTDGLKKVEKLVAEAGIEPDTVILADGHGSDPSSATPRSMNAWLQWTTEQDWGEKFEQGLPVLGESGSLALSGTDSPAKGKVAAKTGTSVAVLPPSLRLFVNAQGLAGFMETSDGKKVFSVYVSGGVFENPIEGIFGVGDDVADVAAAFQQAE